MKATLLLFTAALTLSVTAGPPAPVQKQSPAISQRVALSIPNPQIDYDRFLQLAVSTTATRESNRLTEEQFLTAAKEPGTIVLDARSADKYALRHIKGAISLPFTDFTAESLAKVIPSKTTKVLIYCKQQLHGQPGFLRQ